MKTLIHIEHVVLSLQPGGLENGVVNVVNSLNPDRFRSSVCCLKQAGEFSTRLNTGKVAIYQMGKRGGIDVFLPLKLANLFRRTRPDIVHTRNADAFYYGFLGAKIAGVRSVIHSEHGRTFDERRLRYWVQRAFSRYTDAVFSVSEQLKHDLVARVGIPANRIDVLYNGVDFGRFASTQRDQLRGQLGVKDDEFLVGSVGRLAPVKNFPLLLRAICAPGMDKVIVTLVGDGPERGALEALVRELELSERVRFLGHRDDVADLLAAMDVFVLPSISEGMSNTLLEAMAAGIAVVASNVGGNPEIVRDKVDGLLFESGNVAALRRKLQELLADKVLRMKFGEAGRERVLLDFSLEAMITRYERLYESVFAGQGGQR